MSDSGTVEVLLRRDRAIVIAAVVAMFAIAALYTVFGVGMKMSALEMTVMASKGPMDMMSGGMGQMMQPAAWTKAYAGLVFLMWWVMMIAMMVPSAAPTILLYSALTRRSAHSSVVPRLALVFLTGYLVIWAGFSLTATGLQWALELNGLVSASMMTLTSTTLGAAVLLTAGIYQLSPLKEVCLDHCRSPMQFLVDRHRPGQGGAFRMGLEHGLYCLGCCWFLMALLFFGGIMNLYWIAGLAILVAAEKLTPVGGWFARASGIALVLAGLWVVVQGFWNQDFTERVGSI